MVRKSNAAQHNYIKAKIMSKRSEKRKRSTTGQLSSGSQLCSKLKSETTDLHKDLLHVWSDSTAALVTAASSK